MNNDFSGTAGKLVWCNAPIPPTVLDAVRAALLPHRLISHPAKGPTTSIGPADIAFGQPDPREVIDSPRLRWVHLNTAGYTRYDTAEVRAALASRGGILTNSSSVYDEPCAQHVLAMMMAGARQLPQAWADQHGPHRWPQHSLRASSRLLNGQTAILYGFGAIGRRLAGLLAPLRMNLVGVRRSPRGDEPIRVIATGAADEWLARADHVIDILPESAGTDQYFDARRIESIKAGAAFYNIGRGSTVDQAALISALETRRLAAAFLDVSDPEPLPANHPLWSAPNCHITPHTAGGHADEPERLAEHFIANFRRFVLGEALLDRVY